MAFHRLPAGNRTPYSGSAGLGDPELPINSPRPIRSVPRNRDGTKVTAVAKDKNDSKFFSQAGGVGEGGSQKVENVVKGSVADFVKGSQ